MQSRDPQSIPYSSSYRLFLSFRMSPVFLPSFLSLYSFSSPTKFAPSAALLCILELPGSSCNFNTDMLIKLSRFFSSAPPEKRR